MANVQNKNNKTEHMNQITNKYYVDLLNVSGVRKTEARLFIGNLFEQT